MATYTVVILVFYSIRLVDVIVIVYLCVLSSWEVLAARDGGKKLGIASAAGDTLVESC